MSELVRFSKASAFVFTALPAFINPRRVEIRFHRKTKDLCKSCHISFVIKLALLITI